MCLEKYKNQLKYKHFLLINSLKGGGAERVLLNIQKSLNFDKVFLLENEIEYEIPLNQITLLSNYTSKTNPMIKTVLIPLYALKLALHVPKNSIVLSFLERANYVNILGSFPRGYKSIISVHTSQIYGRSKYHPYNLLSKILYPRANLIIAVSKGIKQELIKFYGVKSEKIKVIYNPIYFDEILKLSAEDISFYKSVFKYPTITTAGRLTKPKGQWYLIRMFKELKKEFSDLKLVILGDGELKDYLVKLSEELKLKTYVWDRDELSENYDVYFLGFQKNPFKFMANSTLFVFPSLFEGLGNVIIESLSCGVPVISSDCKAGPREILAPDTDIEHQTKEPEFAKYGVLMPVFEVKFKQAKDPLDDVEKMWIDTIKKMLKDENLRKQYSQTGKVRAKEFDVDVIIQQWKEVLE